MPERPRKKIFSVKILSGRAVLWHREMDGWIDRYLVEERVEDYTVSQGKDSSCLRP
jgi:hypothetical protein